MNIIDAIRETPIGEPIDIFEHVTLLRTPLYWYRYAQGYVLHHEQEDAVLLIDVTREETRGIVRELVELGKKIDGIVLTHGDLVNNAYADLRRVSEEAGGAPVLVHPADARGQDHAIQDITLDLPLFDRYGLVVLPAPGHTPGSVMLYSKLYGGTLFTGDAAIGAPYTAEELFFERPPIFQPYDDEDLADMWVHFDLPLAQLLTHHGIPGLDLTKEECATYLKQLQRPERTVWKRPR